MLEDDVIRIMLDENSLNYERIFRGHPEFDVKAFNKLGYERGEDDEVLIAACSAEDRFFLTKDRATIDEKKYPPCTHRGILQLPRNKISPQYVFQRLQAMHKLRLAGRAKGHFTHIADDGIRIVTHKETIERDFNDYEDFKNIERD